MIGAKSGKKQTEQRNLGYDTRECLHNADYMYIHQDDANEDWFPEDPLEAFREMRASKVFDVSEMKGMMWLAHSLVNKQIPKSASNAYA
ncbi:unnamed protein product [Arabis nemorensis]|uniref:Uncharacterized protein n=1 Tax=Arabis nemorensis TaxID=586526 RepID=A0A565B427_9BRAS|nr:unnamed protein product [Arabis nemorensis]